MIIWTHYITEEGWRSSQKSSVQVLNECERKIGDQKRKKRV